MHLLFLSPHKWARPKTESQSNHQTYEKQYYFKPHFRPVSKQSKQHLTPEIPSHLLTCLCSRLRIGGGYALVPLLLEIVMPDAEESTLVPALVSIPLSPPPPMQMPPAIGDTELLTNKSL